MSSCNFSFVYLFASYLGEIRDKGFVPHAHEMGSFVKFRATIKFLFNLLDNNSIGRITERNTITRYKAFILVNPHGGENPAKSSLI